MATRRVLTSGILKRFVSTSSTKIPINGFSSAAYYQPHIIGYQRRLFSSQVATSANTKAFPSKGKLLTLDWTLEGIVSILFKGFGNLWDDV